MLKWKQTGFIAAVGLIAFVAGRALPIAGGAQAAQPDKKAAPSQPEKKPAAVPQPEHKPAQPDKKPGAQPGEAPDMGAFFAKMTEMGTPGKEHKALEVMIGEFEGTVKFTMSPEMPMMEVKGKVKREWAMDGRFVIEHVTGDPMEPGGPGFKGMGIMGYSNWDKKYESIWIENMATHMSSATGTYDDVKKTFTFVGEVIDPSGKKLRQTSVVDVSNPDREVMTGTCPGPDGKPFKNFEGVFERKK